MLAEAAPRACRRQPCSLDRTAVRCCELPRWPTEHKGMAAVRRRHTSPHDVCACVYIKYYSEHSFLSYSSSSSAGAVPFLNGVPFRSCTYSQSSVLMLALYLFICFSSAIMFTFNHTGRDSDTMLPCICRMKCIVNLCCWSQKQAWVGNWEFDRGTATVVN
jgi:hypothetical protein